MEKKQKVKHKKLWMAVGSILLAAIMISGVFFWYVSDYYRADEKALEVLTQDIGITEQDQLTILSPPEPSDMAIIFYPGAKVEAEAYLPLLDQIRQTGVTCILVHMPFHMAIFDPDAAESVMPLFPDIRHWYMAGHSMGGAMASKFASDHEDEVEGLILLGAYIYGDYPLENTLTIYDLWNTGWPCGRGYRLYNQYSSDRRRKSRTVWRLWSSERRSSSYDFCTGTAVSDSIRD